MDQMAFGDKWINWIRGCLSSSKASLLVNDNPTYVFHTNRGVRQGDPLSPFLFIIAMEGLHVVIKGAREKNLIKGIKLPHSGSELSHLFYAVDAIFIGDWDHGSIKNLSRILKCFQISSGLKVNFHKSRLFGTCISDSELLRMAQILGCLKSTFPFVYLGTRICNQNEN